MVCTLPWGAHLLKIGEGDFWVPLSFGLLAQDPSLTPPFPDTLRLVLSRGVGGRAASRKSHRSLLGVGWGLNGPPRPADIYN